ncbi:MAG: response regulator [Patescibacteria group bacterium]
MNTKKILIIEDEAAILYSLKARLTVEGINTLTASSAEEGFEILKKEKPDVILLDIILPQMDGLSFMKQLKNDKSYQDIPIIIMSNLNKKDKIEKSLKLGAKDYIVKSEFNLESLINKIKDVITHVS